MHDPRPTYIYMRKYSLLQSIHEAAAKHGTRSISSISFRCQRKRSFNYVEPLWYGRSWPRSQSERGKSNLEGKKNTFILSNYNELVDFLISGMETSCQGALCQIMSICRLLYQLCRNYVKLCHNYFNYLSESFWTIMSDYSIILK